LDHEGRRLDGCVADVAADGGRAVPAAARGGAPRAVQLRQQRLQLLRLQREAVAAAQLLQLLRLADASDGLRGGFGLLHAHAVDELSAHHLSRPGGRAGFVCDVHAANPLEEVRSQELRPLVTAQSKSLETRAPPRAALYALSARNERSYIVCPQATYAIVAGLEPCRHSCFGSGCNFHAFACCAVDAAQSRLIQVQTGSALPPAPRLALASRQCRKRTPKLNRPSSALRKLATLSYMSV
jgi:hypothetical protein